MKPVDRIKRRTLDRLASATARRLEEDRWRDKETAAQLRSQGRRLDRLQQQVRDLRGTVRQLRGQVRELKDELQEARHLSGRLADVVDVVTEVLLPAVDRDDARMQAALARLTKVLDEDAPTT